MTYLSAGFSATCGHGYAVAFIQDGAWLCNDCWQGVRAFVHQATGVILVIEGHDDKVTSDASKRGTVDAQGFLERQRVCYECVAAEQIVEMAEVEDIDPDRPEVHDAHDHIMSHR